MNLKEKIEQLEMQMKQIRDDAEKLMVQLLGDRYELQSTSPMEESDGVYTTLRFWLSSGRVTHTEFDKLRRLTGFTSFVVYGPEGDQVWPEL